ncbi:vanin-like protein 2 [Trichoplusia ni]|uniref:Vanin-like protein 2 n=1 Tax=Trichoplusia ni TaxID=7111 RepID=A0A7E5WI55_TRINI|nr:vanin-like protein 2 [Trichoplusia ni]
MTMKLFGIVFGFLCVNFAIASEIYKAGVIHGQKEIHSFKHLIDDASKMDVDILVLPVQEPSEMSSYDEAIKTISEAAKQAGLYVVLNVFENTHCQHGKETIRSNLVFDREGAIVAVYRKPVNPFTNCTTSSSDLVTFTTDFGVTFGLLMEEDLVLREPQHLRGLKNFVMAGVWQSEIPMLSAPQFSPAWSYVNNVNLLTNFGVYPGKTSQLDSEELSVFELQKNGGDDNTLTPAILKTHPSEDLSQYVIKPLDLQASNKGVHDTVCHTGFCCNFYVKTAVRDANPEITYSLAAFNGVRQYSASHNIGTQNCGVFACTGNQKNCVSGLQKSTVTFERISIAANFTKQTLQYPIIQTALPTEEITFDVKFDGTSNQVTLNIVDGQSIDNFGIFGRDFSKDFESNYVFGVNNTTKTEGVYDFIFNEEFQEVVDYIWIRLRVLIVVVSIYILEMM